jgi:hypothetical protein
MASETMMEITHDMKEICQNGVALENNQHIKHSTSWVRYTSDNYVEYSVTVRIAVDTFFGMGKKEPTEEILREWNLDRQFPYSFHSNDSENGEQKYEPDYSIYDSENSSINSVSDSELCDLEERRLQHEQQKAKEQERSKSA